MAHQGRVIDEATKRTLERLREIGRSVRDAAKQADVAKSTAQKYLCQQKKSA
jgi:transposase